MREERADFARNVQHFLLQQIRFAVFREKVAPDAAAQEREHFRARRKFGHQHVITVSRGRGKRPFHHFGVGSGGKVGASERRARGNGCRRRGGFQPICILFERDEEIFQPTVRVAKFVGAGPHAEFFQVVTHGREAAGMLCRAGAKELDGLRRGTKRHKVAERFQAG